MLDALGAELLVKVLMHLPPKALHTARAACSLLDDACRRLVTKVKLKWQHLGRGPVPDWSRFPNLRVVRVTIEGLQPKGQRQRQQQLLVYIQWLTKCFTGLTPAAAASLAAVEELSVCSNLMESFQQTVVLLRLLLQQMPNLTTFKAQPAHMRMDITWVAELLCHQEPHLEHLCIPQYAVNQAMASHIGALPCLDTITFGRVNLGHTDSIRFRYTLDTPDSVWDALRPEGLACINATSEPTRLLPAAGPLNVPRLVELRNVILSARQAAALARGAPLLRVLVCRPEGDWGALPSDAVFLNITHARFVSCGQGFSAHVQLRRMLPAVQHLVVQLGFEGRLDGGEGYLDGDEGYSDEGERYLDGQEGYLNGPDWSVSFEGLTALVSLVVDTGADILPPSQRDWPGIAALPGLRHLECAAALSDLDWLSKLTALEVLDIDLIESPRQANPGQLGAYQGRVRDDLSAVLSAVADRSPQLRTLAINRRGFSNSLSAVAASVAQLVGRVQWSLKRLVIGREVPLEVVEQLAALPSIQHLHVVAEKSDKGRVRQMSHGLLQQRGLQINQGRVGQRRYPAEDGSGRGHTPLMHEVEGQELQKLWWMQACVVTTG